MKLVVFKLIILLLFIASYNRKEDNNKILWNPSKKLEWNDFKGIPTDTLDAHVAQTQGSIEIVKTEMHRNIPIITVGCYFIKNKSWTKVKDAETLAHEQLHFDIDELFTRRIRQSFEELNKKNISDINQYQKIYDLYIQKCDDFNELYDHEVYFNDKKQLMWSVKIGQELKKLKKFENIDI